jgi:hypothetical protein
MGNLLDANGLARALEIVLQLRGEAGPRQVENINIGLAQSWRRTNQQRCSSDPHQLERMLIWDYEK